MKPKPFSKLWTKRTVQTILKEYETNNYGIGYLCYSSPTFYSIWIPHRLSIQKLASKFDPSDKTLQRRISDEDGNCLFYENASRQLRVAFLNHEIVRLTTKKKSK